MGRHDEVFRVAVASVDAAPWIRPEAVLRGRRRLALGVLPPGEELAAVLMERVLAETSPR
ncbi:MAG: hypothetical protein ACYDAD_15235 [Acidimicrobiales bacterium]